jgi:hypothetical protein
MKHVRFPIMACAILAYALSTQSTLGQTSLPEPTRGEARVREALSETTELDFVAEAPADVVEYVRQRHELQVQLDRKALADAGLGGHTPVTIKLRDISLRSALTHFLREFDLTYLIRDGYLLITSVTEAENRMKTRIYQVGDLVSVDGEIAPRSDSNYNYQHLVGVITSTVSPTKWSESGDDADEFRPGLALVIPQTEDVHEDIEGLLTSLRAVRDEQFKLAVHSPPPEAEKDDDNLVTTKVYLPSGMMRGGMGGGMAGGSGLANGQPPATWATPLVKLLPEFVAPESWHPHGGAGVVNELFGLLIVKQTGEVHREVATFLKQLLPGTRIAPRAAPVTFSPVAPRGPLPDWPSQPEPRPNKREAAIEQALASKTDVDFKEAPLSELREWIQRSHDIQVVFDNKALADTRLALDTPISHRLSGISLREALRSILTELELTFVVANEVLMITSQGEAENMLTTKVYPVLDLVIPSRTQRPEMDYQSLVEILRINVTASSWDDLGGPASLKEYANCGALVISQTTAGHERVQRLLRSLREARNRAEAQAP